MNDFFDDTGTGETAGLTGTSGSDGQSRAVRQQSDLNRELEKSGQLSRQFGNALGQAFIGVALKGQSLTDTIRSLGQSLSEIALRAAFKPLEQGFGSLLENILKGAIGGGTGAAATGAGFGAAMPVPFAKGGVIASPIAFPLGGGTGIAGERGAEAIMPLSRGPDGRLGVMAAGARPLHVTFNVTSPDAESFRRSEAQIAALLARAVGQGQRNL